MYVYNSPPTNVLRQSTNNNTYRFARIDPSTRLRRAILLNDVFLVQRIVRNHPQLLQNPDFDDKSNTSLHLAATHGCLDIALCLLDAGHDAQEISRNADHDTPLMLAARHGHPAVGALLLHRCPTSIPYLNRAGRDVLALAAQHPAATPLLPLLLQHPTHPTSVHARDADGNTPLHHASAAGALKSLRILLAAGANPLATNNHDWTPVAYSQTVAAEVYFKNLVAELERRRFESAKLREERERARAAGVRLVQEEGPSAEASGGGGRASGTSSSEASSASSPAATARHPPHLQHPHYPADGYLDDGGEDDDGLIEEALKRHWSPVERKRPVTPGSARREWGAALGHSRTRSGS